MRIANVKGRLTLLATGDPLERHVEAIGRLRNRLVAPTEKAS